VLSLLDFSPKKIMRKKRKVVMGHGPFPSIKGTGGITVCANLILIRTKHKTNLPSFSLEFENNFV
jgi:hypothetical protein